MAPRVSDLQAQISTLTQELELSTFLNKGILTTNSEHKVRIAELETENAALRAAERRLSATEDALEEAEKKCRAHERERIGWEREVERERQGRVGVEKELEEVKGRLEDLEAYWRGVRDGMDSRLAYGEKRGEPSSGNGKGASRTAGGKGIASTSRSAARQPERTSSNARRSSGRDVRTPRYTEPDDDDEFGHASTSPVLAPSAHSTHRKRRRVETSPSDLGDDAARVPSRSSSPMPLRASHSRKSIPKEAEPKKREAKIQTSSATGAGPRSTETKDTPLGKTAKRSSSSKHIRKISDDVQMKVEPISPGSGRPEQQNDEDDSDADPLAME